MADENSGSNPDGIEWVVKDDNNTQISQALPGFFKDLAMNLKDMTGSIQNSLSGVLGGLKDSMQSAITGALPIPNAGTLFKGISDALGSGGGGGGGGGRGGNPFAAGGAGKGGLPMLFGKGLPAIINPQAAKQKPTLNDVTKLGLAMSGFVLIYQKLCDIETAINKMGKGKIGKDEGGNPFTKMFKKMSEGALGLASLAIAFTGFAIAMKIISTIPIGPAIGAMLALGVFVAGAVEVARRISEKDIKQFQTFGKGMLCFGGALILVSLAVAILSLIPLAKLAQGVVALSLLGLMLFGAIKLADRMDKNAIKKFQQLSQGAMFFAIAMILLGAAVLVAVLVGEVAIKHGPSMLLGLGIILGILTAVFVLSNIVKNNMQNFVALGIGSILLAAALILLSIPVLILGLMPLPMLAKGIGAIALLSLMMLGISWLCKFLTPNMLIGLALLAVISVLLAVSFTLLGLAIGVLGSIKPATLGMALLSFVAAFALMVVIGTAMGSLIMFAAVVITGLVVLAVMSLLMATSFMLLSSAIKTIGSIDQQTIALATANMNSMLGFLGKAILFALAAIPTGIAFAVAITFILPLSLGLAMIAGLAGNIAQIGQLDTATLTSAVSNMQAMSAVMWAAVGFGTAAALAWIPLSFVAGKINKIANVFASMNVIAAAINQIGSVNMQAVEAISLITDAIYKLSKVKGDLSEGTKKAIASTAVLIPDLASIANQVSAMPSSGSVVSGIVSMQLMFSKDGLFKVLKVIGKNDGAAENAAYTLAVLNAPNGVVKGMTLLVGDIATLNTAAAVSNLAGITVFMTQLGSAFTGAEVSAKISKSVPALSKTLKTVSAEMLPQMVLISTTAAGLTGIAQISTFFDTLTKASQFDPASLNAVNSALQQFDVSSLDSIADACAKISQSLQGSNGLEPLLTLAARAADYERIAVALERMAKANALGDNNNGLMNALTNTGGTKTLAATPDKMVTSSKQSDDKDNPLQQISSLLQQWFELYASSIPAVQRSTIGKQQTAEFQGKKGNSFTNWLGSIF